MRWDRKVPTPGGRFYAFCQINPCKEMKQIDFEYPEDRDFFISFLADGDEKKFENEFKEYFDFRDPKIKRIEFNLLRPKLFQELVDRDGLKCQLRIHPDCNKTAVFQVDHVVPLSTNELNKKIRHVKRTAWRKVPAQSFGSNNIKNLIIACKRCNAFKKHRLIKPNGGISKNLSFLDSYPSGEEEIILPSGRKVSVVKYFLKFKEWKGKPIPNSYGNKAVIDFNGEPVFAELAVLKLFQYHGWDGVWVDSYRRKFRIGLPDVVDPIDLPTDKKVLLDSIKQKTGASGGCWDIFVWKDDKLLFIELKRNKKDRIQDSQKIWMEKSLNYGLILSNFILIEWDMPKL